MFFISGPNSDENANVITTNTDRTSIVCSTNNQLTTIAGRPSANHIMVPITQHQQQQLQSTVTTLTTQSHHNQQQSIIQLPAHQQQQLLQQPHGNIILVRGSRNENGQIVLQNSQELLNLLNDDDKPPILLQHPRFKANKQSSEGAIFLQPTVKSSQLDGHHHGTVLLQSATVKKSTNLPEGSIIVQQRLNKNGTADGPILLQTLKRLDKSQSILVFRNPNNTSTATAITTNTTNTTTSNRNIKHIVAPEDIDDKLEAQLPVATPPAPPKSINTPLGSGKSNTFYFVTYGNQI